MRLEERSRELAEENLKKEITNALKMLEVSVSEGCTGTMAVSVFQYGALSPEFVVHHELI